MLRLRRRGRFWICGGPCLVERGSRRREAPVELARGRGFPAAARSNDAYSGKAAQCADFHRLRDACAATTSPSLDLFFPAPASPHPSALPESDRYLCWITRGTGHESFSCYRGWLAFDRGFRGRGIGRRSGRTGLHQGAAAGAPVITATSGIAGAFCLSQSRFFRSGQGLNVAAAQALEGRTSWPACDHPYRAFGTWRTTKIEKIRRI
jgi:hypothetical protein